MQYIYIYTHLYLSLSLYIYIHIQTHTHTHLLEAAPARDDQPSRRGIDHWQTKRNTQLVNKYKQLNMSQIKTIANPRQPSTSATRRNTIVCYVIL